jgi:putative ABC transport system permease protein
MPNWGAYHYVRLAAGADPEAVVSQVSQVMNEVRPRRVDDPSVRQEQKGERLQALTDIHLAERALYDDTPHRNPAYLWAFGAIAVLILVITAVNYANLALALYADRTREIGIRKAMGGYRRQIAGQFLAEAGLLALACVPLALGLCAAVLPAFNALIETQIAATRLLQPSVLAAMVGLSILTGLAAGGYPAGLLARKRAVELFGRGLSSGGGGRGWSLRHGLIGLQFVVLIGLGSLSWIAYDQLRFMQSGDLGYQTAGVVELTNFQTSDSTEYLQLKRRLGSSSAIRAVGTGGAPGPGSSRQNVKTPERDVIYDDFYIEYVDVGWFEAMGLEHPVVDQMRRAGLSAPERVFINRAAAERLGFDDPVGEELVQEPGYEDGPYPEGGILHTVAGVLPNMHLRPMRQEIKPTIFRVFPARSYTFNAIVRFTPGRTDEGMQHVREVWSEIRPDAPFQATFLSDRVAQLYDQERQFSALAAVLAGLAILLAAIGLASLVAYLTRLRTKEIGVRKALGGSVSSIVALLNKEYIQIVGAAFVVGAPLAWLTADWWLGQFAYQIDLSPIPFLAAGMGALIVAVTAVSTQALRAARVDPAQVLRSE